MTATKRRLRVLESLFSQRVDAHVATILPLFLARYHGDELRQVAALLRAVGNEPHDAGLTAAGAALLREWRAELSREGWAAMWLLPDVLSSVDAAIDSLSLLSGSLKNGDK